MKFGRASFRHAVAASRLLNLTQTWRAQPPLILMYHGVSGQPAANGLRNFDGKHMPPAAFAAHLRQLRRTRKVIALADMVSALAEHQDLRGTVAITLDDGYENNALVAAPLLAEFNLPAAFFLTTGLIGMERCIWTDQLEMAFERTDRTSIVLPGCAAAVPIATGVQKRQVLMQLKRLLKAAAAAALPASVAQVLAQLGVAASAAEGDYRFMNWQQARELVSAGFEVGAHTVSHPILSKLPFAEAATEILHSREQVVHETGQCSTTFCFPNGKMTDFDPRLQQFCRTHFQAALSTERGAARVEDLFELKRLSPAGPGGGEDLAWMMFRGA
jgi:peptidoglycan/xylan/chitin deacetylase (PgdA/CDA1 family)